jgi:hypothetical protein
MRLVFAALDESGGSAQRRFQNARSLVAMGVEADIEQSAFNKPIL